MDNDYVQLFGALKNKIRQARQKIVYTANSQLLEIYWEIGRTISMQMSSAGWGAKIIDRLASDLKAEFPDMTGLSIRSLKYMRAFADAYPRFPIVQSAAAQLENTDNQLGVIVQPPVAQLSWTHHTIILDKVKSTQDRLFYIQKSIENGWSKIPYV